MEKLLDPERRRTLALEASRAFSPTAPIDEMTLFAGRQEQARQVVDAVNQRGQHAIVFGERGVGKTSLANVLADILSHPEARLLPVRVNCDGDDSLDSLWRKVFEQIELENQHHSAGFESVTRTEKIPATAALMPDKSDRAITTDDIRRAITLLSKSAVLIIVIDEFDRLPPTPRRAISDTIKTLSDHSVGCTVVLVGVADNVDQLIHEHQSIERALVQVHMPRMTPDEVKELIAKGLARLGMKIQERALSRVLTLAQGLPHYAHLIGLSASRSAIDRGSLTIGTTDIEFAITDALKKAQQSIRSLYHKATMSPRKDNLFGAVLLSCALAETDDLGYFAAQDLRKHIRSITGKPYDIPSYAQHLNEFCEDKRGPILQRIGSRRRYRFRFVSPLIQPYVIMKGFADGSLTEETA